MNIHQLPPNRPFKPVATLPLAFSEIAHLTTANSPLRQTPLNLVLRGQMDCNHPSVEVVANTIRTAFDSVQLGNGIGLWQAQAIDDYESEDVQLEARKRDRKTDWELLSTEDLQQCWSSLCFFDSEGMRFHLPAFLLSELDKEYGSVLFSLTQLDDYKRSMFTALDQEQRHAVTLFLEYCLSQKIYSFEHPEIEIALREYWSPTS